MHNNNHLNEISDNIPEGVLSTRNYYNYYRLLNNNEPMYPIYPFIYLEYLQRLCRKRVIFCGLPWTENYCRRRCCSHGSVRTYLCCFESDAGAENCKLWTVCHREGSGLEGLRWPHGGSQNVGKLISPKIRLDFCSNALCCWRILQFV